MGDTIPSVVLPRKNSSAKVGGVGKGEKVIARLSILLMNCPAETGFPTFLVAKYGLPVTLAKVAFAAELLSHWIWNLKFGIGPDCWSSLGRAQLHILAGKTQPEFATGLSGWATVEIPEKIGGNPVRLSH